MHKLDIYVLLLLMIVDESGGRQVSWQGVMMLVEFFVDCGCIRVWVWLQKNVIIHCREEGCIGKYAPWGNLEGRRVQIAPGGIFSNTPLLSAVYYYNLLKECIFAKWPTAAIMALKLLLKFTCITNSYEVQLISYRFYCSIRIFCWTSILTGHFLPLLVFGSKSTKNSHLILFDENLATFSWKCSC